MKAEPVPETVIVIHGRSTSGNCSRIVHKRIVLAPADGKKKSHSFPLHAVLHYVGEIDKQIANGQIVQKMIEFA